MVLLHEAALCVGKQRSMVQHQFLKSSRYDLSFLMCQEHPLERQPLLGAHWSTARGRGRQGRWEPTGVPTMATAVHMAATHTAAAHTGAAPTAVPMAAVLGGCTEAPRMAEDPWGAATAATEAAACTGGLWARGMGGPMVAGTGQPMAAAMLTGVVLVPA